MKPANAAAWPGASATSRLPPAAIRPLSRTDRTGPSRPMTASPDSLPPAIVIAKTPVAAAAVAWLACSSQRMNTADQSLAVYSTKMAANAIRPRSRDRPRGQAK